MEVMEVLEVNLAVAPPAVSCAIFWPLSSTFSFCHPHRISWLCCTCFCISILSEPCYLLEPFFFSFGCSSFHYIESIRPAVVVPHPALPHHRLSFASKMAMCRAGRWEGWWLRRRWRRQRYKKGMTHGWLVTIATRAACQSVVVTSVGLIQWVLPLSLSSLSFSPPFSFSLSVFSPFQAPPPLSCRLVLGKEKRQRNTKKGSS